jgi:hypothetical protein
MTQEVMEEHVMNNTTQEQGLCEHTGTQDKIWGP